MYVNLEKLRAEPRERHTLRRYLSDSMARLQTHERERNISFNFQGKPECSSRAPTGKGHQAQKLRRRVHVWAPFTQLCGMMLIASSL